MARGSPRAGELSTWETELGRVERDGTIAVPMVRQALA